MHSQAGCRDRKSELQRGKYGVLKRVVGGGGRLTDAGAGLRRRGPVPRPVEVKILAHITVGPGRVMLAHAHGPAVVVAPALGGVPVTLTPASNLQV